MMKSTIAGSVLSRFTYSLPVVVIVLMGLIVLHPETGRAQPGCEVSINKVGIPGDPTVFPFVTTGTDTDEFGLENGEELGLVIKGGVTATIVEDLPEGWLLRNLECGTENVIATKIENGVQLSCSPNGGAAICYFFNTPRTNIPTLSEWGMIAVAAGLGLVGVFYAMRRRRAVV